MNRARSDESIDLLLASRSPRRRELLDQVQLRYATLDPDVDETPRADESAGELVERLACAKAEAGRAAGHAGVPVLAADTAVVLDGVPLGKPEDEAHALAMLADLSGRSHMVITGIAVAGADGIQSRAVESRVTLRPITDAERRAYWASGEPSGKAGAYAIQGLGAVFVERLEGSYSNVVGLPLFETIALLRACGVDPLRVV